MMTFLEQTMCMLHMNYQIVADRTFLSSFNKAQIIIIPQMDKLGEKIYEHVLRTLYRQMDLVLVMCL